MTSAEPEMAARSRVGPKPIGHEHARCIALLPEELAHQPQGGGLVPLRLDEQVEDLALAVDGAPQIHAPAPDRDDHLVRMPGVGGPGPQPAFAEKVEDIVGLYMDPPAHAIVLSIDEKSQIQPRIKSGVDRTQPGLPLKPGKCGTMTRPRA